MIPKSSAAMVVLAFLALGLSGCTDKTDESPSAGSGSSGPAMSADPAEHEQAPTKPPMLTNAPGDVTLTFSGGEKKLGQGSFDKSKVTISAGQTVEFQAGDGGTYAVKVGGLDGATISGGLKEYFRFDAAGTYEVVEDLSGATASIVVK